MDADTRLALQHMDLDPRNIMVEGSSNTGIIDWDGAVILPAELVDHGLAWLMEGHGLTDQEKQMNETLCETYEYVLERDGEQRLAQRVREARLGWLDIERVHQCPDLPYLWQILRIEHAYGWEEDGSSFVRMLERWVNKFLVSLPNNLD
ncbi:hypothetical protein DFS34DRAFT_651929 [Phlyctochytrium arcticum]|nr:hypothetical protein DFS34DRAFT_651929 [Phlyctochytrium arcticum]